MIEGLGGAPTWYVIGVIILLVIAFCVEGKKDQGETPLQRQLRKRAER